MFNNVLVGVDGHEGGRDAIALARVLKAEDGELTLAHVYHASYASSRAGDDLAERERACHLLEEASEGAGITAALRWRASSSVGRGLHEIAEACEADLLVVGSSRRGLVGRILLGDDTRAALNGSPCALAVAPVDYCHKPIGMREIGVGYDASPESGHALSVARALAAERGTSLSAFRAIALPAQSLPPVDYARSIRHIVDDAREQIAALDGVEPHAAYGDPVEELTLYSASLDLLVVGSRGYGPIGRLVHGSTSQGLARTVRCPLLVLTRSARTPSNGIEPADRSETRTVAAN